MGNMARRSAARLGPAALSRGVHAALTWGPSNLARSSMGTTGRTEGFDPFYSTNSLLSAECGARAPSCRDRSWIKECQTERCCGGQQVDDKKGQLRNEHAFHLHGIPSLSPPYITPKCLHCKDTHSPGAPARHNSFCLWNSSSDSVGHRT